MPVRALPTVRRVILRWCLAAVLPLVVVPPAAATTGTAPSQAAQGSSPGAQRPANSDATRPPVLAQPPAAGQAADAPPSPDNRPASASPQPSEAQLIEWAEQLGSEQYVQREISSLRLAEAGVAAVPALEAAVRRGELETTERALQVLQRIAVLQQPDQPSTAWDALSRVAQQAPGSASARAGAALETIAQQREQIARERLNEMGIRVGLNEFVLEAAQVSQEVCHIPGDWNGRPEALAWVQWLYGIEFALLDGPAADGQVLAQVAKMPDLRNVIFREARIAAKDLRHLSDLQRIDNLELRYIPIDDGDLEHVAKLPLRASLVLTGTRVSDQGLQQLREKMPGLRIVYKKGGFLGVTCSSFADICQISTVVAGGAAEAAGLRPRDIITRVDDVKIERFSDLQDVINTRLPGDSVTVVYDRLGTEHSTRLTLGQMPTQIPPAP